MAQIDKFIDNVTPLDAAHLNKLVNTLNELVDKNETTQNVIDNLNDEIQNIENIKESVELVKDIVVSEQVTNIVEEEVNLFDKTKGEPGYINSANGQVINKNGVVGENNNWTSDYIACIPGQKIRKDDNSSNTVNNQDVCFFTQDKVYISGIILAKTDDWKTFTIPDNAYFFRFDMLGDYKDTEKIYAKKERHEITERTILGENIGVKGENLIDFKVEHLGDDILTKTGNVSYTNLFDKTKGEPGYFSTAAGRVVVDNNNNWTSDYIACIPGQKIRKDDNSSNNVNDQDIGFFTQDKVYISGIILAKTDDWKTFTIPDNAYFFRFDMLGDYKDTEKIYVDGSGIRYDEYHLSDKIKVKKSNIIGSNGYDDSIIVGDAGDIYKLGVDCRGNVYSKFINTEIPIVEITGDLNGISKEKKVEAGIKFKSKVKNFEGKCTLKWQGNGSTNYPKKNYSIKLFDNNSNKMKIGFKNWIPQDSYHLKANFTDSSHMRNIFSANLMFDARKEYLPTGGRGIIDGFPVKVKINGVDQGIYTWNLKQSKEVYGLTKENPNHLMYRCEEHHGAGSFASISNINTAWEDKFPETNSPENLAKLSRMIEWVANADNDTFKKDIHKYLNLNYLIDCWIYAVCFTGSDSLGRNLNIVTYDGEIWYTTLYDMDTCMGNNWNGTPLPYDLRIPSQAECKNSVLFKKLTDNFKGEIINRYLELRNTLFATESMLTKIKEYMDFIGQENYQLDKRLWPTINSTTISYSYISNNIMKRFAMIDADLSIITDGR